MGTKLRNKTKTQKENKLNNSWSWNKESTKQLKHQQLYDFYYQLENLLQAGMEIRECFAFIIESGQDKGIAKKLDQYIQGGSSLSEAMETLKIFPEYDFILIQIAEETGNMERVISRLKNYYKEAQERRRMLISAITYPAFVMGFTFITLLVMLLYIVPMFAGIYNRLDGELPSLTLQIIGISDFIKTAWIQITVGISIVYIVYNFYKSKIRVYLSGVLLKLPYLGKWIKEGISSQFAGAMALMLESGVPLSRALDLAGKVISNPTFKKSIDKILEEILEGHSLYTSMKAQYIFDPMMLALIHLGEESNRLQDIFNTINEKNSANIKARNQKLQSLLEPVMIIFIGAVVGVILIAMYLPMFKMGRVVG
jgi:type IV pilus assembly protein PilC